MTFWHLFPSKLVSIFASGQNQTYHLLISLQRLVPPQGNATKDSKNIIIQEAKTYS
jgi:hypothetical protein